jgi:hypothetical protein
LPINHPSADYIQPEKETVVILHDDSEDDNATADNEVKEIEVRPKQKNTASKGKKKNTCPKNFSPRTRDDFKDYSLKALKSLTAKLQLDTSGNRAGIENRLAEHFHLE